MGAIVLTLPHGREIQGRRYRRITSPTKLSPPYALMPSLPSTLNR